MVDLSVGGQEFSVGDGFIIGDGNYNKGGENGQYWSGGFLFWRNSAILKINTNPLRADLFWLRSDTDFKDARVAGINVETTIAATFGTLGVMYLEILQGGQFNYDGMKVWNFRGAGIKISGSSRPICPTTSEVRPCALRYATSMFGAERLLKADEVFLTSSAGGVMPVTRLDGQPVGNGQSGAITLALRQAYWHAHHDPQWTTPVLP